MGLPEPTALIVSSFITVVFALITVILKKSYKNDKIHNKELYSVLMFCSVCTIAVSVAKYFGIITINIEILEYLVMYISFILGRIYISLNSWYLLSSYLLPSSYNPEDSSSTDYEEEYEREDQLTRIGQSDQGSPQYEDAQTKIHAAIDKARDTMHDKTATRSSFRDEIREHSGTVKTELKEVRNEYAGKIDDFKNFLTDERNWINDLNDKPVSEKNLEVDTIKTRTEAIEPKHKEFIEQTQAIQTRFNSIASEVQ